MTTVSTAHVATDRAARYGKQLASHLGRKQGGEWSDDDGTGWIQLSDGRATLAALDTGLELRLTADSDEALPRLEDVVTRHLVRFGERDELSVTWIRDA